MKTKVVIEMKKQPDEIHTMHVGYRHRYMNLWWGSPQQTIMYMRQQLLDESDGDYLIVIHGKFAEKMLDNQPRFATSYGTLFIDDITDPENVRAWYP